MRRPLLLLFLCFLRALADWSSTPAPFPLAVRSPYLNSYINGPAGSSFSERWPQFWNLDNILGWSGVIRIDGKSFVLWGGQNVLGSLNGLGTPTLTGLRMTATQTILSITAGPMRVTVTFLSPIEPHNLALQSFPFSYVTVDASATDNSKHSLQFYSDISHEWVSGNPSSVVAWNTTKTSTTIIHSGSRPDKDSMAETSGIAEDSIVYYAMAAANGTTYQTGTDTTLRLGFASDGKLNNTADTKSRAINQDWPVLAHSIDLGEVEATSPGNVVWGIGLVRDPGIDYEPSQDAAQKSRSSYFWTLYSSVDDAIDAFMSGFNTASKQATSLDNSISSDVETVSNDYSELISLSARQAMALDYTVAKGSDGNWNKSDIMVFAKDVGTSRRVNPVEVLYASFSSLLYFNETWLGYALEPLLRAQDGKGVGYAAPDLGDAYPTATFDTGKLNATRAIEDSGSMLIMGWAHAKFSNDTTKIQQYYALYKEWADCLSANTSDLSAYTDSDSEPEQNVANLALKGILGVRAMAEISAAVGSDGDHSTYLSKASSMISSWKSQYTSSAANSHLVATAGNVTSWSLAYNLFADRLLGFDLVDRDVYSAQDTVYTNQARKAQSSGAFGIVYDSNTAVSKSHWTLLSAAATSTKNVQSMLIEFVHNKATSNAFQEVFPITYNAANGTGLSGFASPALGSMFSVVCMNLHGSSPSSNINSSGVSVGAIAGGVVGGVVFIALVIFGIFFYRRRKLRQVLPFLYSSRGTYSTLEQHELSSVLWNDKHANTMYEPSNHAQASPRPNRKGVVTLTPEGYNVTSEGGEASSSSDGPRDPRREAELQVLRREVEELRAREDIYNPPPEYPDDAEAGPFLETLPPPVSPEDTTTPQPTSSKGLL